LPNEKRSLLSRLVDEWPAKALSVAAALVLFLFNRMSALKQEYRSVPLVIRGSERFMPAEDYPRMVRVGLRGEPSEVPLIKDDDLEAYVDLSAVVEEGLRSFPVQVRRKGAALDADPLEISVEPMQARLRLESSAIAVLPINPRFRGFPEAGYERVDNQISPPSAEIRGPRSLVAGIKAVYTEEVDMTGINSDMDALALLEAPSPFVALSNSDAVRIRVTVRKAFALKTFEALPIESNGLRPWLALAAVLPQGVLKLQGSQESMKDFAPGPGALSVDLGAINAPGTYVIAVVADVPKEFTVAGLDPAEIEVAVKERE
jgi:hypothetical protein